jgi:hypothetical protein
MDTWLVGEKGTFATFSWGPGVQTHQFSGTILIRVSRLQVIGLTCLNDLKDKLSGSCRQLFAPYRPVTELRDGVIVAQEPTFTIGR